MVRPEELEKVSQLVEGDLPPDAARSLEAEMVLRPEELAEARRHLQLMKATASTLPDRLSEADASRLIEGVLGRSSRAPSYRAWLAGGLAAAAIVIILALVRQGPTTPADPASPSPEERPVIEEKRSPPLAATRVPSNESAIVEASPVEAPRQTEGTTARHIVEIRAAFAAGDLKTAQELAAQFSDLDVRIAAIRKQIEEFIAVRQRASTDPAAADRVAQLDLLISGGTSVFTPRLASRTFVMNLKEGLEAKSAGNLVKAYKLLRAAHDAEPSNSECTLALNEIKARAHEVYMEGYVEKGDNPEAARAKFKQVIEMTPPDDENHIKAKARLSEMGP